MLKDIVLWYKYKIRNGAVWQCKIMQIMPSANCTEIILMHIAHFAEIKLIDLFLNVFLTSFIHYKKLITFSLKYKI